MFDAVEPSSDRVRVLLLLPSLHGGGAERVAVQLMRNVDRSRFDLRMGLLRKTGPYLNQLDPTHIDEAQYGRRFLDFDQGNSQIYQLANLLPAIPLTPANVVLMLRRFRPHVVMSFRKGMSVITRAAVALYGRSRTRWIAREGNNTLAVIDDEVQSSFARRSVRAITGHVYRSADRLLSISHEMADDLERELRLSSRRVRTIHNAVDLAEVGRRAAEPAPLSVPHPYIIGVGRLERQKGFDVLLRAFARSEHRAQHHVVLVGEGSCKAELRALAAELGISERVHMIGWQNNPWALMRGAEVFVLPSRWEGFGNVVVEAMACRVPVVVSDCSYGPKEIVRDGLDGLIVPRDDAGALQKAVDAVLGEPELRVRLVHQAALRARAFDVSIVVQRYEDLFAELHASLAERN